MKNIKLIFNESLRFSFWGNPESKMLTSSVGAVSFVLGGFINGLVLALLYGIGSILFSSLVACILVVIVGLFQTRGYFLAGAEKVWSVIAGSWVTGVSSIALLSLILIFVSKSQFLRIISDADVYYVLFMLPAIARWSIFYPAFSYSKKDEHEHSYPKELFGFAISQKVIIVITIALAIISALLISLYGVALMFVIFLVTDVFMRLLKDSKEYSREDLFKFFIEANEIIILALVYIFFTLF